MLPSGLWGECTKIQYIPSAGLIFTTWSGLWLGQVPVALKKWVWFEGASVSSRSMDVSRSILWSGQSADLDHCVQRSFRHVDTARKIDCAYVLGLHGWCKLDGGGL